jgi:hypothetical protein
MSFMKNSNFEIDHISDKSKEGRKGSKTRPPRYNKAQLKNTEVHTTDDAKRVPAGPNGAKPPRGIAN